MQSRDLPETANADVAAVNNDRIIENLFIQTLLWLFYHIVSQIVNINLNNISI